MGEIERKIPIYQFCIHKINENEKGLPVQFLAYFFEDKKNGKVLHDHEMILFCQNNLE